MILLKKSSFFKADLIGSDLKEQPVRRNRDIISTKTFLMNIKNKKTPQKRGFFEVIYKIIPQV
tara:strand:+ start:55 stop:243 length:189 start_codon:yes stop_codon:yes gene_type:complete